MKHNLGTPWGAKINKFLFQVDLGGHPGPQYI